MKKYLVVFLTLFLFNFSAFASHFMGGEITWKCIKSGPQIGKYVFKMVVYRDCSGAAFGQSSTTLNHHNYPAVGGMTPILMNFISAEDISPIGAAASGNACYSCANGDVGAVEEFTWLSDTLVLGGSPPAEGWHFTWGTCCRSSDITNGMNDDPWTLRAVMFPYNDPIVGILPANPCYDSSPKFKEKAKTTICTGYPFSYSHNASDDELDEIRYSWSEPLGENLNYDPTNPIATALAFAPPYSVNFPIPGNPTLEAETGEISYFANISGVFVTCLKVEAKKCGQLVAEIYREVQVQLIACPVMPNGTANNPPIITSPIGNQTWINTSPPGDLPSYSTTVYAGDLVTFNIQAEDLDTYAGGTAQDITLNVSGGEFSANYVDPLLCENPPCATFNNGFGVTPPFSAPALVSGVFEWQTHCDHIYATTGCGNTSSIFTFVIKAEDDFCPANGIRISTLKITVDPPSPDLNCISVQDNGDIDLTWKYVSNALPTLDPVYIWHATDFSGPYTLIDSVLFPINTYTDIAANGNNASQYYFLSSKDACAAVNTNLHSDTLQSIFMDVTPINLGVAAYLNWNPIHDPLLSTSVTDYDLYLKIDNGLFTNYLTTPLLTHQYDAIACDADLQFYVEIPDASGCVSKSSIGTANLSDTITPIISIITDVSVDVSGKSVVSWMPSPGADSYTIYIWSALDGWIPIDTVFNGALSCTYDLSDANQEFELFSIRASDSCWNGSLASYDLNIQHNSMYLEMKIDACNHTVQLDWNEYINWDNGLSHYRVLIEETDLNGVIVNAEYRLIDETLLLENIIDEHNYTIFINAYNQDSSYVARSNTLSFIPDLPKKPDYNYIEYASVNHENNFVDINCLVDNQAIINHYDVLRSFLGDNNFNKIGQIVFNGSSSIYYTDQTAITSKQSYQYQIYPVDTCGVTLFPPPYNNIIFNNDTSFAQTILLETVINSEYNEGIPNGTPYNNDLSAWGDGGLDRQYTNTLTFNEYEKWLGDVSEYKLYRSVDGGFSYNTLPLYIWNRAENPDEKLEYIDIVTEFGKDNGRLCYYIHAVEGNGSPYGAVSEGSYSNISCVSQIPVIFIPSVFTPNGDEHNEVFYPISFFVDEAGYSFTIYNRSGTELFATNNPKKGWDGTYLGNLVQNGNYIYHLQFINGVGNLIEKTDVITLVR